jgi:GLPGLI family protein
MKNFTLAVVILLSGLSVSAQKFEGTITYEMVYENLSPQIKPQVGMLPKSSVMHVKDNLTKTLTPNAMGGEIVIIQNTTTDETLQLINMMGSKIATQMTSGEKKELRGEVEKPEIKYTEKSKQILGYTCKNAIATDKNGNEIEVYYTEELKIKVSNSIEGMKGFPMEIVINQDMFTMTQTVVSIKKGKVKRIKMEIPSDYAFKTIEDLKKMGAGGM